MNKSTKTEHCIYYHGSPIRIDDTLTPHPSHVLEGDSAVFASPSEIFALFFISKEWSDDAIMLGSNNGELYAKELCPWAFNALKKSGYLYRVDSAHFHPDKRVGMQSYERISYKPVPILHWEKIENPLEILIKSDEIRMIPYYGVEFIISGMR